MMTTNGNPNAPLYFHARCHVEAGICAYIEGEIIVLECGECHKEVVRFRVVEESPAPFHDTREAG